MMRARGPQWWNLLIAVLGGLYMYVGISASGLPRLLGILGGLLVLAGAANRWPRLSVWLVVAGALPLAAASWWSAVTPLIAILLVVFAGLMVRRPSEPLQA